MRSLLTPLKGRIVIFPNMKKVYWKWQAPFMTPMMTLIKALFSYTFPKIPIAQLHTPEPTRLVEFRLKLHFYILVDLYGPILTMGDHKTPQKLVAPCTWSLICAGNKDEVPRDCWCSHDLPFEQLCALSQELMSQLESDVTHHLQVVYIGEFIFLLDGPQLATIDPLQPPDSSMCHYLRNLSHPCDPLPTCYDCMFKGGPPNPEGMTFHWYS